MRAGSRELVRDGDLPTAVGVFSEARGACLSSVQPRPARSRLACRSSPISSSAQLGDRGRTSSTVLVRDPNVVLRRRLVRVCRCRRLLAAQCLRRLVFVRRGRPLSPRLASTAGDWAFAGAPVEARPRGCALCRLRSCSGARRRRLALRACADRREQRAQLVRCVTARPTARRSGSRCALTLDVARRVRSTHERDELVRDAPAQELGLQPQARVVPFATSARAIFGRERVDGVCRGASAWPARSSCCSCFFLPGRFSLSLSPPTLVLQPARAALDRLADLLEARHQPLADLLGDRLDLARDLARPRPRSCAAGTGRRTRSPRRPRPRAPGRTPGRRRRT